MTKDGHQNTGVCIDWESNKPTAKVYGRLAPPQDGGTNGWTTSNPGNSP